MNWDQIQGNWKQLTGKVKEKWGKLTDDDLTMIAGKRDQLAGIIQDALWLRQRACGKSSRRVHEGSEALIFIRSTNCAVICMPRSPERG